MVSLTRSADETVDVSPSLGGSSLVSSGTVGIHESIEYCKDADEDSTVVCCNVEAAASRVVLTEVGFRKVGPSLVTEVDVEPPRDASFEGGGERRFSLGGDEVFSLPGNGSHTRISIMSPTSIRRFGAEGAEGKLEVCIIGGLPSSALPSSANGAIDSL